VSRRSYYFADWRDSAAGKRARRAWTDVPGKPARYLFRRRRGLRRFALALVALAITLCLLAVFS